VFGLTKKLLFSPFPLARQFRFLLNPAVHMKKIISAPLAAVTSVPQPAPFSAHPFNPQPLLQKTPVTFMKKLTALSLLTLIAALFAPSTASAAAKTASVTGAWNATATWGGSAVPVAGDTVTINDGITVTVTADAACSSVTFLSTGTVGSTLAINSGITLTVSGAITIPRTASGGNNVVAVGAGTLAAGSVAFTSGGTATRHQLTISTGTVTVTGDIAGANASATITFTAAGTLNAGGAVLATGTLTTFAGSTVNYNGAAQTVKPVTYLGNLTLSGSGTKTLQTGISPIGGTLTLSGTASATTVENLAITGNLNVGSGTGFTVAANFTLGVTGTTTVDGTLTLAGTGAKTFTGNVTVDNGGTWNETGVSTYSFAGNLQNDGTFTANTGVHTFSGATKTLSGANAIIIPSVTVSGTYANNGTLTVNTALAGSGTLTQGASASAILNIGGTSATFILVATGSGNTVNYTGASQAVKATTYNNLVLSGSGAAPMATGTSVTGNLSIAPTGSATASVGTGLNLTVHSLTLGGVPVVSGTWGSTTATSAVNHNNTYFAATTGYLTVSTGAAATRLIVTLPGETFTSGTGNSGTATSQTAGGSFNIALRAVDGRNGVDTTYVGSKTVTYTGPDNAPGGATPTYASPVTFTSGVAASVPTTLVDAETTAITADISGSGLTDVASSSLIVNAGTPTAIAFVQGPPASVTAAVAMSPAVTVKATDFYSNPVGSVSVTMTMTGTGVLTGGGPQTTAAGTGIATFSGLSVNLTGTGDFLTAHVASPVLSANSSTFNVTPGAIASYAVSAAPATRGTAFNVTVTALDGSGNTVTTDNSTQVTMTSSTGNVQFTGNPATLSSGTFTISALDNFAETVTITATDANLKTGNTSVTLNGILGDYRSQASGNWGTAATWQTNNGTTWVTALAGPTIVNTGEINVRSGHTVTVAASVSVAAGMFVLDSSGTVSIANGQTLTVGNGVANGVISDGTSSNGILVESGVGHLLTLTGNNSYGGVTTISGGTVSVTNVTTTGNQNLGNGGIIFDTGGTLLNTGSGAQSTAKAITLNSGGGVITMAGPTMTLAGTISGGGGLTSGGSDLILNPSSTANIGTMTVNSGRVFIDAATALGNSAVFHISSGATLDFAYAAGTPANTMVFASGACLANRSGSTITANTANMTFPATGTMIFNQDDLASTAITVSGAYPALTGPLTIQVGGSNPTVGTVTLSGAISGGGGLTKTSTGTLILSAANSYAGGTTVSEGTLDVSHDGGLGSGNVTVASGATLQLDSGTTHNYISDSAAVSISGSGKINLVNAADDDTVAELFINSVRQSPGTYGNTGSGATNIDPTHFAGSGVLNVGSAVTFTTSGSWTVPAGVTTITVEAWGGGGGGGRDNTTGTDAGASGGGGGAYARKNTYAVTPGSVIAYTVGGAGTGDTTGTAATAGGTTSFPTTSPVCSAGGGGGAVSGAAGTVGAAGTATVGDVLTSGAPGSIGVDNGANGSGGAGGAGANGGAGGSGGTDAAGTAGTAPGGGGGGGEYNGSTASTRNGANGAAGQVRITYKLPATVTLSDLTQTYTGSPLTPTATTDPPGLTIDWTLAPQTAAGTYTVTATINDSTYQGSASDTFTINQRPITVTAAANTKQYDGTLSAAATPTGNALQNGDVITSGESYDNASVGTTHVLTPAAVVIKNSALTVDETANYNITPATISTGVIQQRPITVTAAANTKQYDGTLSAAATPTGNALQNGDVITSGETYDNVNVGTTHVLTPAAVVIKNSTLTVDETANYSITPATISTGVIQQRPITVTAAANTKQYDGTLSAAATPTGNALQNGDVITSGESYDNANVGTTHVLTPAAVVIKNSTQTVDETANYNITPATIATGVIQQRPITVTAAANSKPYDGTLSAAATPTGNALQNGDVITSGETYDNANVGTTHVLTPAAVVIKNSTQTVDETANYNITPATIATGVISALPITVTATGPAKTYGTALTAGTSSVNFTADPNPTGVGSETVTGVTLTPDTAGATATTAADQPYVVTPSAATGTGGFLESNYQVTYNAFTSTVGKKPLTVTATGPAKTYGTALTAGTSTVDFTADPNPTGVGSETVTSVTLTPDAAGLSATTAAGQLYVVTPSAATGTGDFLESNYQVNYVDFTSTVSAAGTTTGVATSGSPKLPTDSVTFTATVSADSPSTAIPTGTLQFKSNGNDLGTPVTVDPSGVAQTTITASDAGHGNLTITAVYANSDGNFTGSTGTLVPDQVVNTPPEAGTQNLTTAENTALNVSATDLASLNFDADGDTLTIPTVNSPSTQGGTVSLSAGTITYNPPSSTFVGADSFTYTISDPFGGTATSTANVTVRETKPASGFTFVSGSSGTVNLRGYGIPNTTYNLQISSDMSNWSTLTTVTAGPSGVIRYTDTTAGDGPRFYRFAVQ
jgi:hypothetical protein